MALPSEDELVTALDTPSADEPTQLRFTDRYPEWDGDSPSPAE